MKTCAAKLSGLLLFLFFSAPAPLLASPATAPMTSPWDTYDALLKTYVSVGAKHGISLTLIDYTGLKSDPRLQQVLTAIAQYPRDQLNTKDKRLAFYINTYNLLAIKMVADHWPIDSIKDVGSLFHSVWNKKAGIVMGRELTLDEIENDILRPMGDPHIHFAIVCASVSCPNLRPEAYRVDRLGAQLNDQVRGFLANPRKGMRLAAGTLTLSPIFDWFDDDFETSGGVLRFIQGYRSEVRDGVDIRYFDYDWSVNARRP